MRVIKLIMSIETQQIVYSYFHSLMTYGIIFWGNSSCSMHIFRTKKRLIRVKSGLRPNDSCRDVFKEWIILPLQSQYTFSLLIFMVNNMGSYHQTSQIHGFNPRCNFDLYCPQINLKIYHRGLYYFGIKLFNHLPSSTNELACNAKRFRVALSYAYHIFFG
jgi:hypothetical protein